MANVNGRQDANRDEHQEDAIVQSDAFVPAWRGSELTAAVSVSRALYSRRAVLAAAYKLSDRGIILVDADGDDRWVLYVVAPAGGNVSPILSALVRELGDQALRDRLEEEFGAVRTLIVAQAFAEGNLIEPARDTADHRLDPFGTEQRR